MANKTVTVRPSGGDYTSLSAAITGEVTANADLTATGLDGILTISIEGTWSSPDTAAVVDGFTVDSTHYVRIVNNATNYNIVANSTTYTGLLGLVNHYTRVRGNGLTVNKTGGGGYVVLVDGDNCFLDGVKITGATDGEGILFLLTNDSVIANCIIYGSNVDGVWQNFTGGTRFYNCLSVGNAGDGFDFNGRDVTAINCYAGGNGGNDWVGTGTVSLTDCYSEDGTLSTTTVAYSTATFTSITVGSEDFSLPTGSALIDQGTDLSADATYPFDWDIEGTTRDASWDVGAYEYVVSSYDLTASSISSATSTGTSSLSVGHGLSANGVASTSHVGSPAIGQVYGLGGVTITSTSHVGSPTYTTNGAATGIVSVTITGNAVHNSVIVSGGVLENDVVVHTYQPSVVAVGKGV